MFLHKNIWQINNNKFSLHWELSEFSLEILQNAVLKQMWKMLIIAKLRSKFLKLNSSKR